jgi:hypothetical protein
MPDGERARHFRTLTIVHFPTAVLVLPPQTVPARRGSFFVSDGDASQQGAGENHPAAGGASSPGTIIDQGEF